jgi:ankyrin repeat protein
MQRAERKTKTLLRRFGVPLPTGNITHALLAKLKPRPEKRKEPVERPLKKFSEEKTKKVTIPKGVVLGDDIISFIISETELAMCVDALPNGVVRWLVPVPPADTESTQVLGKFKNDKPVSFGGEQYFISDAEGGFAGARKVVRTGNIVRVFPDALTQYDFVGDVDSWMREALAQEKISSEEQKKLNTALLDAAEKGDLQKVDDLLGKGAHVNARGENGTTPLMWAAWNGNVEMAKLLIKRGANVNARTKLGAADAHGETVLMIASFQGHAGMVEYLISKGVRVNDEDGKGRTARMFAAVNGHESVVEILKKHEILEAAAARARLSSEDRERLDVALLDSMRRGDTRHIRSLLDAGADANVKDESGWSVLMWAAVRNQYAVAELLIERGADVNAQDGRGVSVLDVANEKGSKEVAELLMKNGATAKKRSSPEEQMELDAELLKMAWKGDVGQGEKLIDNGANVDARGENGEAPMVWAIVGGNEEFVKLLVARGADVNAQDRRGRSILGYAVLHGKKRIGEFLKRQGAKTTANDDSKEVY